MTERHAVVLYAVTLVPAGWVAVALSAWVMDRSGNGAPRMPSGLDGWALNVVPAFAAGMVIYLILARVVHARLTGTSSVGGHVRRSAWPYLVAIGLGVLLLHDGRSPDFWSFGQLVLWPWLAAVGGIVADGLTTLQWRRRKATAIADQ
jgi:hypothetical protein